jgi:hypothetical protein
MKIKLPRKPREDTRDLPDDYDPHYFYEYRIMERSKVATGIEGLVYKLMPWDLIRSFAFAIDPFSNFKTAPGKISLVNRTRIGNTVSILDTHRMMYNKWVTHSYGRLPGTHCQFGPIGENAPNVEVWSGPCSPQPALDRISKDTTRSTRAFGYDMGEFEKEIPRIFSGPRSLSLYAEGKVDYSPDPVTGCPGPYWASTRTKNHDVGPSAAIYRG